MENKKLNGSIGSIGNNVKTIRTHLHLKQNEMANALNITSSYLSEIESGKKNPGREVISNLLEKYNVNPSFLLTGEGDFFISQSKAKTIEPISNIKENDIYNSTIAEMLWYFENIPVVGFSILQFFKNYLHEKKDMIETEIKKIKEKNPHAEIPGS